MQEKILYCHGGVRVSTARIVAGAATYPIAAVTSVRLAEDTSMRQVRLAAALAGGALSYLVLVVYLIPPTPSLLAALAIAVTAAFLAARTPANFEVLITTAAGERSVLCHECRADAERLLDAINRAIVARLHPNAPPGVATEGGWF